MFWIRKAGFVELRFGAAPMVNMRSRSHPQRWGAARSFWKLSAARHAISTLSILKCPRLGALSVPICPLSPYCYTIPFGRLDQSPVIPQPQSPNLAVCDMVLDSGKYVSRLEFRCVASETIFGILGVTLLEASDRRLPI